MNRFEAGRLKVGDTICTDKIPVGEHHEGKVTEKNWMMIIVQWDDGQSGGLAFDDCEHFYKKEDENATG